MKGIGEKFPVQSVNNKTGIVSLDYDDVNAPSTTETNASGTWNINAKTASKLITTF